MTGTTFEVAARQAVARLHRVRPELTWLVALNDALGEWAPVAIAGTAYGTELEAGAAWDHTVCAAHERGEGPAAAPVLVEVPAYADAPITREITVGCWVGATIRSGAGVVLGSVCGLHPVARPGDDLTALVGAVEASAAQLGACWDRQPELIAV